MRTGKSSIDMRPHEVHLSPEEIALIIEGNADSRDLAGFYEHIRECAQCAEALRDSAVYCTVPAPGLADSEGARAVAEAGGRLAVPRGAARASSGPWNRRLVRYSAFATAAAMILAAGILIGNLMQPQSARLAYGMPSTVRGAIETISSRGPIVMPGGEGGLLSSEPVHRAGYVPLEGGLQESVDELYRRYRKEDASPDVAYWLLSAYVAASRIDIARDIAADARKRFPDDTRIAVLDAIISYIDGDYARAESVLRDVVESGSDDPLVKLDLAVVLIARGSNAEAKTLLARVIDEAPGTPLAGRAGSILAEL